MVQVYRCLGLAASCGDVFGVQTLQSWSLLSAMSLAIHLASGRPNTCPLLPTDAVHSLPVLLAPTHNQQSRPHFMLLALVLLLLLLLGLQTRVSSTGCRLSSR